MDLVAVVQGIVHTDYLFNLAKFAQQIFGVTLLFYKLAFVRELLHLAAAAFTKMRARRVIVFCHVYLQFIILIYSTIHISTCPRL